MNYERKGGAGGVVARCGATIWPFSLLLQMMMCASTRSSFIATHLITTNCGVAEFLTTMFIQLQYFCPQMYIIARRGYYCFAWRCQQLMSS